MVKSKICEEQLILQHQNCQKSHIKKIKKCNNMENELMKNYSNFLKFLDNLVKN